MNKTVNKWMDCRFFYLISNRIKLIAASQQSKYNKTDVQTSREKKEKKK